MVKNYSKYFCFLIIDRWIDGVYDVKQDPENIKTLPCLKYPPYISFSAYLYRLGPMNKDENIESIFNYILASTILSSNGLISLIKRT